jgi:hypothetical protein
VSLIHQEGVSRRAARCVLALVLIGLGTPLYASGEHTAVAAGAPCPVPSLQYALVCYPPQQKAIAQRRFGSRQVDPSHILKSLTGEPLTQVVAGQRYVGADLRTSRRVTWLEYDFGPVPTYIPGTPTPTATPATTTSPAKWTMVIEHAPPPQFAKVKGMHVAQTLIYNARWEAAEDLLVHHDLAVSIFTTESRAMAVAIGRALIKQDKRG